MDVSVVCESFDRLAERMLLERDGMVQADAVLAISRNMRDLCVRYFGIDKTHITVVHNAIDGEYFADTEGIDREAVRLRYARPDQDIVLFFGRLFPQKGVDGFIAAIPKILERRPNTHFVVAGTGPRIADYLAQVEVPRAITFTGHLSKDEVRELLAASDVGVFPSRFEPFGLVALESMAAGVPVVVADIDGLSEIVDDGVNGRKVSIKRTTAVDEHGIRTIPGGEVVSRDPDVDALAQCITELLEEPETRQRLAEAGRQSVVGRFSSARLVDETLAVYQQAIKRTQSIR